MTKRMTKELPAEGMVDIGQLAAVLRVSRGTIYNHVKSGALPAPKKIGRQCRWNVAEVRKLIEG